LDLFEKDDPAMFGPNSLLATDQGIRGFLSVVNDLLFISAQDLNLVAWTWEGIYETAKGKALAATEEEAQKVALKSLSATQIANFIDAISSSLADYDWRTSSTPGLSDSERVSNYFGSTIFRFQQKNRSKGRCYRLAANLCQKTPFSSPHFSNNRGE